MSAWEEHRNEATAWGVLNGKRKGYNRSRQLTAGDTDNGRKGYIIKVDLTLKGGKGGGEWIVFSLEKRRVALHLKTRRISKEQNVGVSRELHEKRSLRKDGGD